MITALAVLVVIVLLALVFVAALGRASRQLQSSDREASALATLAQQRSPSGKPFFASELAAIEFAETLEDENVVQEGLRPRRHGRRSA